MTNGHPERHRLHLGIAEGGKALALKGDHKQALQRYREALRLAHSASAPQMFGRHYLQCILESLEHLGDHAAVRDLAARAAEAAASAGDTPFHRRDRAALLERVGIAELKAGDQAKAQATFAEVVALAGATGQPLSALLLDWIKRGFVISPGRLAEAQRSHAYWAVRRDTLDPARVVEMPAPSTLAAASRESFHGR